MTKYNDTIYADGFYENDIKIICVIDNHAFVINTVGSMSFELESVYHLSNSGLDLLDLADSEKELKYLGEKLPPEKWLYLRKVITLAFIYLCELELSRLGCNIHTDPTWGLRVSVFKEEEDSSFQEEIESKYNYPIQVSDIGDTSFCDAEELYSELKELRVATLDISDTNIWLIPCLQNG